MIIESIIMNFLMATAFVFYIYMAVMLAIYIYNEIFFIRKDEKIKMPPLNDIMLEKSNLELNGLNPKKIKLTKTAREYFSSLGYIARKSNNSNDMILGLEIDDNCKFYEVC